MSKRIVSGLAAALAVTLVIAPGAALADKGGKPNQKAVDNARAAAHAHMNGPATDPHPDKGNDSDCYGDGGACGE